MNEVKEGELERKPFIRYRCSTMASIFSLRTSETADWISSNETTTPAEKEILWTSEHNIESKWTMGEYTFSN